MPNSSSESEMEKSVAEKVSNDVPDDLVFSILLKLPLKSLKRFGCACKSWALLFENPHFMNMYGNNFISKNHSHHDDASLLLQQSLAPGTVLYLLSGERFENRVKLDWPTPFQEYDNCIDIVGSVSVNGILCLSQNSRKIVLWNPAIDEFKVIPPSPSGSVPPYRDPLYSLQGFGYDHVRDDYKVIRHVVFFPLNEDDFDRLGVPRSWDLDLEDISYDPLWEIYSLRSNSWRILDVEMPDNLYPLAAARVYMDGVCHWWGGNEALNAVACLVSFDLGNEVFLITPMPPDMDDGLDFGLVHLVVLNGSIAFISFHVKTTTFHISILGELGVKESWTKLFIVGPLPCVEQPIGMGKKGNIFFKKKDDELAWLDLSTQMIVELGAKGRAYGCQIVIYKESLLSIGLEK